MASIHSPSSERRRLTAELDNVSLTRLHCIVLMVCSVGFSFDLAEIAFGNIISAVFSAPPHSVDTGQLSLLLAAVYIGAAVGAPLLGILADRFGRRKMLISAMVLLAVASVFAGASYGIGDLIAWRAAAGLALGAYPPLMFAYLTDILPARRRGPVIVTATAFGYLGPPAFIFLVRALTPVAPLGVEAWRWGFVFAGAGAAACAAGFWALPESPRWLLQKERLQEAERVIQKFKRSRVIAAAQSAPVSPQPSSDNATLEKPRSFARDATFLLPLYFLTPWATVGFTVLSGAVLVQKGINLQDSLMLVGISTFGPIAGTLAGGFLVDRVERKVFLAGCAIGMGAIGLAFGASELPSALVVTALLFNVVLSLFMPVLVLYAAEGVSTANRGKLTALAWTANRVGSALVPLILLPVLQSYGAVPMFIVIAATLILFVVALALFGPRGQAGRAVG